ncbi:MAG: CPBP family intramembrane glutamic endopeptidase [Pseudomonadota bacterium]
MPRELRAYAPNARQTAYLSDRLKPASAFLFAALTVFLGWFFVRQTLFIFLPEGSLQGETRLGFTAHMAIFALLAFFTMRAARYLHSVDWRFFLGDPARLLPDFLRVLGACAAIYAILIAMGLDPSLATMRPLAGWLAFLPLALVLIFLQTGAEELFFRGYIHHFATVYLKEPLLWLAVPSAIFGLSHVFNDTSTAAAAFAYIIWTFAFGVACVDLTARTGSLGAAWGLHFAVNVAALGLASEEGAPMSAAALFLFPARSEDYAPDGSVALISLVFELFFLAVLWLAARNAVRR